MLSIKDTVAFAVTFGLLSVSATVFLFATDVCLNCFKSDYKFQVLCLRTRSQRALLFAQRDHPGSKLFNSWVQTLLRGQSSSTVAVGKFQELGIFALSNTQWFSQNGKLGQLWWRTSAIPMLWETETAWLRGQG